MQRQHIKQALLCSYIHEHNKLNNGEFKEKLIQEIVNWVYDDKIVNSNYEYKFEFHEYVSNCFRETLQNDLPTTRILHNFDCVKKAVGLLFLSARKDNSLLQKTPYTNRRLRSNSQPIFVHKNPKMRNKRRGTIHSIITF